MRNILMSIMDMLQPVLTVGSYLLLAFCLIAIGIDADYRLWLRRRVKREEQERKEREEQEQRSR